MHVCRSGVRLCGVAMVLACATAAWGATRESTTVATFPAPRIGLKAVFGENGNDHGGDLTRVRALADHLASLGVRLTRIEARWTLVEKERGTYDFSEYDLLTSVLTDAGIEPMFMIYCAPPWAMRGKPAFEAYFEKRGVKNLYTVVWPADAYLRDFEEFCCRLAHRYRSVTHLFEFWCEPDGMAGPIVLTDHMRNPADIIYGGDTVLYTRWLRACYRGIKQAHPRARLAAGSLSVHDLAFLKALYAQSFQNWCDAVSLHPYAAAGFDVSWVKNVRRLMLSHGDGARPLWLTEFGWNVQSAEDHDRQCAGVRASFAALADLPYVTQAYFFTLNDWLYEEKNPEGVARFGLLDEHGTKRPAYTVFRDELRRFEERKQPAAVELPARWFTAYPGHVDPGGCVRFTLAIGSRDAGTFRLGGDAPLGGSMIHVEAGRHEVPVVLRKPRAGPCTERRSITLGAWKSELLLRPLWPCPFRSNGPQPGDLGQPVAEKPTLFLAWNRQYCFVRVATFDPDHRQPYRGSDMVKGDAILVALDPDMKSPPGARYLADDQEYLLGHRDAGASLWRRYAREPSWVGALDQHHARFAVLRKGATTTYELDLPWKEVTIRAPQAASRIGASVAIVDLRATGRTARLLFGGGVLEKKEPAAFGVLVLQP